jgi:RAB protein geranylgeranyltransferase component A
MKKLIKKFLKDVWNYLWSKTSLDEKAIETLTEVKKRYKLTAQEIQDIAAAMKEVGNQIDDIPAALAGKKRKGRKTKK